jgi:cobalamin biosynthesis Mg chelatase CobN
MFDSDGEDEEEDKEVAVKKKMAEKRKLSKSEGTGKRKREKEKPASAKKTKQTDSQSDSDAGEKAPSSEKSVKKPETPTTGYGKRVEHLKSIIKSCGMRFFNQTGRSLKSCVSLYSRLLIVCLSWQYFSIGLQESQAGS